MIWTLAAKTLRGESRVSSFVVSHPFRKEREMDGARGITATMKMLKIVLMYPILSAEINGRDGALARKIRYGFTPATGLRGTC